jgi:polyribonucleotide nucleotidyltransferase
MADTLAGVGASAALMISDIPFKGPIATVRVGRIDGEFVINPTRSQMEDSDMAIIVSGNEQTIVMVEGEAKLITEEEFIDAMKFAHGPIKDLIAMQNKLIGELDIVKRDVPEEETDEALAKAISELVTGKIDAAIKTGDKADRENQISTLKEEAQETFVESHPESEKLVSGYVNNQLKTAFREQILADAVRSDGRKTTDIRQITIETGILARTHGSALFTRGETQAIVVLTMGTPRDQQIIDSMDLDTKKKFFLHYNFPPYSVGEARRLSGPGRRDIGHGALARRALLAVMPDKEKFQYCVRVVSEILESNGSSSMASVCGGSLSMMDAGVPLKEAVAGIAMGLVSDGQKVAVLTDIIGDEDHYGDMDFKVTGTSSGITALQMDIKIENITRDIMEKALEQAREARLSILDKMNSAISRPRARYPSTLHLSVPLR